MQNHTEAAVAAVKLLEEKGEYVYPETGHRQFDTIVELSEALLEQLAPDYLGGYLYRPTSPDAVMKNETVVLWRLFHDNDQNTCLCSDGRILRFDNDDYVVPSFSIESCSDRDVNMIIGALKARID